MAVRFGGTGGGGGLTSLTVGVGATAITGGTAGRVLFETGSPVTLGDSANLTFSDTGNPVGGALFTAGTSTGTSAGMSIGTAVSGFAALWDTIGAPTASNYLIRSNGGSQVVFQAVGSQATLYLGAANVQNFAFLNSSTTPTIALGSSANAGIGFIAASVLGIGNGTAGSVAGTIAATNYRIASTPVISGTAPTVSSGFGTSPVITANGTATFRVDVGSGGTATGGVLTMPAATNGWNAMIEIFNPNATNLLQTTDVSASATNSLTISNVTTGTGVAAAWPANTVLMIHAMAY